MLMREEVEESWNPLREKKLKKKGTPHSVILRKGGVGSCKTRQMVAAAKGGRAMIFGVRKKTGKGRDGRKDSQGDAVITEIKGLGEKCASPEKGGNQKEFVP